MSLLDGLLQQAEGAGISAIASKLGIPPALAQVMATTVLSKMSAGQDAHSAAVDTAGECGVDAQQAHDLTSALADHSGADGVGGLLEKLGGADAITGMLGGLLGGGQQSSGGGAMGDVLGGLVSGILKK